MPQVNASILTIGDELLIGQTIDTNSAWIGRELNAIGIWVQRRWAIGDNREQILEALQLLSLNSDVIIITGGLGPTADDITKPTLCEYFNTSLVVNEEVLANVQDIFKKLGRPMIERNLKQAEVPASCTVLPNRRGTAPGMWFENEGIIYISLPGVPHEMIGLMRDSVIPKLLQMGKLPAVLHHTLLTAGIGESALADQLEDFEKGLPEYMSLAYLPSYGLVRLRLTARGDDATKIQTEIRERFHLLQSKVAQWLIAPEDIPLEEAVNRLLKQKQKTLSTAESCTGGYIAHLITSRPGSSAIYQGSIVAYANTIKQTQLNVQPSTLENNGAVSEATVIEMAKGALQTLNTDYVIATSGIMGPEGGTPEKPVGTVWIAVGSKEKMTCHRHYYRFDRERNIELTAHAALTLLYRFVNEG
jgi:nicotinamide-nucleotide amidase